MGQRRLSVLVADDDVVSLRFLAECIAGLGHDCTAVADGLAALAAARAARFDLILLDLNMPGLGGRVLLHTLRADADARSQRIDAIAMSADMQPALASALRADGFLDVVRKPLSFAQLERYLREAGHSQDCADPQREQQRERTATCESPDLDDDAALLAVGSSEVLEGLRALFVIELPQQLAQIDAARTRGDTAAMRDILHRLRSGCRFCGASALHDASVALADSATASDSERAWLVLQARAATLLQRLAQPAP